MVRELDEKVNDYSENYSEGKSAPAETAGRADVEHALVFPALLADRARAARGAPRRDRRP
jgi:hypothetical protein